MMRTLNVRLAAICLVVVVLLGGGVHLLHAFQVHRQANALKIASERAEKTFKELRGAIKEARDSLSSKDALGQTEEQTKLRAEIAKKLADALHSPETSSGPESNDLYAFLRKAQKAEREHIDEAIRILESYVVLVPKDRKEQLHLGMLYAERLDPDAPYVRSPRAAYSKLEEVLRTADEKLDDTLDKEKWHEELRKARKTLVDMALQVGRPADAETHVKKLLEETPKDPELLDLAGQALVSNRKDEEACQQFRQAIGVAPTQIDTYERLASVFRVRLDRKTEADKVMLEMVSRKDDKGNVINAKSKDAFQKYANYLREQGKPDEALVQAKRVLELAPEDPVGLWIAGTCYLAKGQYNTAEDYLNRGIKADKGSGLMYVSLAETKVRLGRLDEAIAVYKQGLATLKEKEPEAITDLDFAKYAAGYAEILLDLSDALISDGKHSEAAKYMREFPDVRSSLDKSLLRPERKALLDAKFAFLDAKLAVHSGEWKHAKKDLEELLPKLHDYPYLQKQAYLYLGECYRQQGDVDRQIVAFMEAVKIDPYFRPARIGLGDVFMSRGNLPEAAEQYRKIGSDPDAALSFAQIMIMNQLHEDKAKRDWGPVDKLLDEIEKKRLLTPRLAAFKAEVILAKSSPKEAAEYLRTCLVKFPQSIQVWSALINLSMHQAERVTDPGEKEKFWQQAAENVNQAEQTMGDRAFVRGERGNLAVRRKDPQAVAVLKKLGENLDKLPASEKIKLWGSLGGLSLQANDLGLARSYYRLAAKEDPKNIGVRYVLCNLNLRAYEACEKGETGQTPDTKELDELLHQIETLEEGHGPYWVFGNAVRTLVQSKKDPGLLSETRGYLKDALEVRKDWLPLVVLAGKICERQDEPEQALDYYLQAIYRMGERDGDVIRRAVHLLLPLGRVEEAQKLVDFLDKQKSPLTGEMNQIYVSSKVVKGDIAEAEKVVERSVAADSRNYEDFLRQGQLYGFLAYRLRVNELSVSREERPDPEKVRAAHEAVIRMADNAKNSLLKARTLNPQEADAAWLSHVQLLVTVGQPEKARTLVAEAEASLKGEKAAITLARCYDLLNESEKAQAKYDEAAKAAPKNARVLRELAAYYLKSKKVDRAEPRLKEIISLESPATLTDACWARRNLALLMSRGDFDQFRQGMALIDENLHSKAASIDDNRMKVSFLISDPRKEKLGEAIQAMEDLVNRINATPEDYFNLARLYLRKGDWPNYAKSMRGVLGAQKGAVRPDYLVFYIGTLLERKELDEADNLLQTLEKVAPNNFETVRLRAEYQFLRGNCSAAGDLATGFLDNPKALPQDRGQQLLLVAATMEQFGDRLKAAGKQVEAREFREKASTLFTSRRRLSAKGDIIFANYLARQKQVRECLEVLEQCKDKGLPEDLQSPAATLMQTKATDSAQRQQLEKIVVAAAKEAKHPVPLLLILAELHAQQGQYDKSIADYREILGKDPRNCVALNNLGLDLARNSQDLDEAIKRQNLDEALSLVNQSLTIAGPMAALLDSRALVYILRQEPEKALEDAAAAVRDEGSAEEYFHQAWAYRLAGKKTEAKAAFDLAMNKGLDRKALDPRREVSAYDKLKDGL